MTFFGKKELLAQIENLKQENGKLYVLGLKQAREMKLEVEKLLDQIEILKAKNHQQLLEIEAQKQLFNDTTDVSNKKLNEVQSESELLLLQLHQVQEELESVFLKEQEAQQSVQTLNQSIAQLRQDKILADEVKVKLEQERTTLNETIASLIRDKGNMNEEKTKLSEARDEQTRIANERQVKIDSLSQVVDGKLKNLQEQNEQLQKSYNEAHEKISKLELDKVNLNQKILTLTEDCKRFADERDEQSKIALERQNKIDGLSRMVDGQIKEVQEENELLLLQLHQVQEELEHHFLEHQKLQRDNELLNLRWKRLEEREPNYLDYESILPVAVDTVSNKPKIDWRAQNITIAQEAISQFDFTTFLEDGMPGIEFLDKQNEKDTSSEPIRLIPRALVKPNANKVLALYRNMSMRHWQALSVAVRATEEFFKSPKKTSRNQKLPDFFDPVFWRQSLAPLVADFKSLPAVFRFNEVKLKREQVNPDYEHLWLEFEGAMFGRYVWPSLEVRFAAANIQSGGFSRHPKVEIPKIHGTTSPFDSWFEESQDDFGPKMELRFDLNKQFFDLDVWARMSAEDRAMLISLIGSIPIILKRLEDGGAILKRPWDNWNLLALGMVDILRRVITEADKVAKEAEEAKKNQTKAIGDTQSFQESKPSSPINKEIKDSTKVAPSLTAQKRFPKKKKR